MIVNLHKYLLCGHKADMDRFFEMAQKAGFLEFISISHKNALEMPEDAKILLAALKIASAHTVGEDARPFETDLEPLAYATEVVKLRETYERLLEEERLLKAEMARVAPFGAFSRDEMNKLEKEAHRVVQFYVAKNEIAKDLHLPAEVIYLGTEYELSYFVAINRERTQYPKLVEVLIERPIDELKRRKVLVKGELEETEKKIHDSARAEPFLHKALLDHLNTHHLHMAKHNASKEMGDTLFAIEAWVPENKVHNLHALVANLDIWVEEVAIDERDRIPTCMENKGAARLGEDLVQVYDTPSATDNDPSLWVLVFFTLFFSIIIADAGYGLIYLTIILYARWRLKGGSGALRRFLRLGTIIASGCIVWGIFTASFFGIELSPVNPLRKISFINVLAIKKASYHMAQKDDTYNEYVKLYPQLAEAKDGQDFLLRGTKEEDGKTHYIVMNDFYDTVLLELSLFIGTIHLMLSFLRYLRRNWPAFGWILFLMGGYLYFPYFVDATSFINYLGILSKPMAYALGKQLVLAGLILVFALSIIQKRKLGAALHELTNSIQVFADVLSYIRLYALALAGMVMAMTFNDLASQAGIFGVFILLIGHTINLGLAIMSGTIHGLRLNFLEWYHYSFEGGGKMFNPLRILK